MIRASNTQAHIQKKINVFKAYRSVVVVLIIIIIITYYSNGKWENVVSRPHGIYHHAMHATQHTATTTEPLVPTFYVSRYFPCSK